MGEDGQPDARGNPFVFPVTGSAQAIFALESADGGFTARSPRLRSAEGLTLLKSSAVSGDLATFGDGDVAYTKVATAGVVYGFVIATVRGDDPGGPSETGFVPVDGGREGFGVRWIASLDRVVGDKAGLGLDDLGLVSKLHRLAEFAFLH